MAMTDPAVASTMAMAIPSLPEVPSGKLCQVTIIANFGRVNSLSFYHYLIHLYQ